MKYSIISLILCCIAISSYGQREGGDNQKFAIKITPTQMIVGELNLAVEFKTTQKTSIEIAFGPTISELGFGPKGNGPFGDINNGDTKLNYESGIGYFGALGFRFYPLENSEALQRLYIMPQLKYRTYNTIVSEETGLWDEQNSQRIEYKFHFNVGYQLWASKSFGFDFFLGGGMGYRESTEYTPVQTFGGSEIDYIWDEDITRKPQLLLTGGIKVAIGG